MKKSLLFYAMLLAALLVSGLSSCTQEGGDYDARHGKRGASMSEGLQNYRQVTSVVDTYYGQCKSMEELGDYLPEILELENVEKAYFVKNYLFVRIKDYGTTSYVYFDYSEDKEYETRVNQQLQELETRAVAERTYINPDFALTKAIVANEQHEQREWTRKVAENAVKMLNSIGIEAIPDNSPNIDFFENQIYENDIIFYIGHGVYDDDTKLHWVLTSQEVKDDEECMELKEKYGETRIMDCLFEEKRYYKISDRFFELSNLRFKKPGKAIFLAVPCEILMGGKITKDDKNERDFAFADALKDKGLGFFMGYDETNRAGQISGLLFLGKLVSGLSINHSYSTIPYKYIYDEWTDYYDERIKKKRNWVADLLPSYSDENSMIAEATLTRPVMSNVAGVNTQEGETLNLTASAILYREPLYTKFHKYDYKDDFKYAAFTYGFEYSETQDFKAAIRLSNMSVGHDNKNNEKCAYSNNKVTITQSVPISKLKGNTTYYFRAFFYDGQGIYNYSDYKNFTTPEKKIEHVVPIEILDPMKPYIPIYDGENPPDIQGTYVIDPMEIVYDKTGNYEPGYNKFSIVYFNISNQNFTTNTLDYQEKEIGNGNMMSESEGKGAFISGEGNNFSVYFNTTGVTHLENYDVNTTDALVISGTKTSDGIRDLRYAFVIVKKSDDPENRIMNVGDFRVFKDGDNWAEATRWPSGTRIQQITVRDGIIFTPWSIRSLRSR
ncbi:MAG: hypothetical protein IJ898_02290 [Prevotella sp.]|nr:hypothetical protein [Prevotella sp.]